VTAERIHILLVEDNLADVRLTREALREVGRAVDLDVAGDGDEALAFLRGEGRHRDRRVPDLVLLDLNLPRKSGHDVLAEMRRDDRLRRLPVIVLTTSVSPSDVEHCYDLGANCYIVKPLVYNEFRRVVALIEDFWLGVVRLPERPAA
jgi:chemotaxis family two-component system response regulator Rcp1